MSWQPIVVGVDASSEAAGAAALGWRIAQAANAKCHLVHACRDLLSAASPPAGRPNQDLERAIELSARHHLETALEGSVPLEGLNALIVRPGRTPLVLGEVVNEVEAGLVVLGGKHHSALNRWLGGSTALNAVRALPVPVLVATGPATAKRRIMVAVDLSHAAQPAIEAGQALAALFGGQLRVLHVVEPIPILPEVPVPYDLSVMAAEEEERFGREIWPLVTFPGAQQEVRHGVVPETIFAAVRDWRPDLLVVGSHGKGWIDRMILGSVAESLLNGLPTSLLVVPAPVAAETAFEPAREPAGAAITAQLAIA